MRMQFSTVAELFAEPSRWTQGAEARDAWGDECDIYGDDACAWCLLAAVERVYGLQESPRAASLGFVLNRVLHDEFGWTALVDEWNDHKDRTHADILRVVRVAGI